MIDLLSTFNMRATIKRGVQTTANAGTTTLTYTTTATGVPCRVSPMNGRQAELYGRYVQRGGNVGYFDPAVTLTAKDRVIIGSRTFDVQFVEARPDDNGDTLSVFAVLEETR